MGNFSAGPINKAVQSLTKQFDNEYMNGDGRYSKHLSLLKKCVRTSFALSRMVETF